MGCKVLGCALSGREGLGRIGLFPMPEPLSQATQTFGERVRARRHDLKLSQEAMADQIGIHWTFLGQVERGQRNVSLHNLLKLSRGLGVDAAELVQGLQPPEDEATR
jgi:ribosome-binding protein aMBF1 (putative translation factor)